VRQNLGNDTEQQEQRAAERGRDFDFDSLR
jgi:hypothetical protein